MNGQLSGTGSGNAEDFTLGYNKYKFGFTMTTDSSGATTSYEYSYDCSGKRPAVLCIIIDRPVPESLIIFMKQVYEKWLLQAVNDLEWGHVSFDRQFYAQACFISQQVAEKSLKALAYFRGAELIRSHSCIELSRELQINGKLEEAARILDQYYISTRYPDALAGAMPYETYTEKQAAEALEFAALFINTVKSETGVND